MALNTRIHVDHTVRLLDQPFVESLMVSLDVVMLRVLLYRVAYMLLSQWDDLGQTLRLNGAYGVRKSPLSNPHRRTWQQR